MNLPALTYKESKILQLINQSPKTQANLQNRLGGQINQPINSQDLQKISADPMARGYMAQLAIDYIQGVEPGSAHEIAQWYDQTLPDQELTEQLMGEAKPNNHPQPQHEPKHKPELSDKEVLALKKELLEEQEQLEMLQSDPNGSKAELEKVTERIMKLVERYEAKPQMAKELEASNLPNNMRPSPSTDLRPTPSTHKDKIEEFKNGIKTLDRLHDTKQLTSLNSAFSSLEKQQEEQHQQDKENHRQSQSMLPSWVTNALHPTHKNTEEDNEEDSEEETHSNSSTVGR